MLVDIISGVKKGEFGVLLGKLRIKDPADFRPVFLA